MKEPIIDMHMHSIASDGTFTPSELVIEAKKNGLKEISLTDHDNIDGLKEAIDKGNELGINIISGIEFSTEYLGKEVHVLGYLFDINNKRLNKKIIELRLEREKRTELILKKLAKYKLYLSMKDLLEEVKGNIISRTHIANAMIKKGYVYSKKEAFKFYLSPNGSAYVPRQNTTPFEAIKIIKESGGVASLAHPSLIGLGKEKFELLLNELIKSGLDAIEVFYPEFSKEEENYYKKIADIHNLAYTGGSDFHGMNRPQNHLGIKGITKKDLEILTKKLYK